MRVKVEENEVYDVRFGRRFRQDEYDRVDYPLIDTLCSISTVDDTKKGKEKYTPVVQEVLKLSHKDKYNKWAGRKESLRRALEKTSFNRDERRKFWDTYKNYFGKEKLEVSTIRE